MKLWIKEASGKLHEGVHVQGAGGPAGHETIRREIRRADKGQALLIYEPKPGHVEGFIRSTCEDTDFREIDLRGAEVTQAEWGVHRWSPSR
jgi:hypothetical protein